MNRASLAGRCAPGLLLCALGASTLSAQVAAPTDTSRRHQTLFTAGDAALAAGFAGPTVAMFPADRYVARHLRDQSGPPNKFVDNGAKAFEVITVPGALIIGPARYSHQHPDNFIDRVILKTSIAPDGHGGGVVAWTIPAP